MVSMVTMHNNDSNSRDLKIFRGQRVKMHDRIKAKAALSRARLKCV